MKKFVIGLLIAATLLMPSSVDANYTGWHYYKQCVNETLRLRSQYGAIYTDSWGGRWHSWSSLIRDHGVIGICY
jgi:hypothetical protein